MKPLRVLLVEPNYHKRSLKLIERAKILGENSPQGKLSDDTLWYPPLGLMKISEFHKRRGDEVHFALGCDDQFTKDPELFESEPLWFDRIYITTLFTYEWKQTIKTIEFYKRAVGGSIHKIYIGGIMASLMAGDIYQETGIHPIEGILSSPRQIGIEEDVDIDRLPPDYDLLDNHLYAINETFYAYTTRGCVNRCGYCGVPRLEPKYTSYIDIKEMVRELRARYGDKPKLKLMDNNILPSPKLERIVEDLLELGYGRNDFTDTEPKRKRVIDFNQGLDAKHLTEERMRLLSELNIKPMRIAFDHLEEKDEYVRAIEIARKYGVTEFSNYMLFNWHDTPRSLYERLMINIKLNEQWREESGNGAENIYSYPMRYAPIDGIDAGHENRQRDYVSPDKVAGSNLLDDAVWNRKFIRNVEIMKSAVHGAISPTPGLAKRTIGETYEEFIANLYMPEELLRNRNKYEKRIYEHEPTRKPGTGDVEEFRGFILRLLEQSDEATTEFHKAISQNNLPAIKDYYRRCQDKEIREWIQHYMKR